MSTANLANKHPPMYLQPHANCLAVLKRNPSTEDTNDSLISSKSISIGISTSPNQKLIESGTRLISQKTLRIEKYRAASTWCCS